MSDGVKGRPEVKRTLIEEGTDFTGGLEATCHVVVKGRMQGELSGPSVEISESGVLSGKVKVTDLISRGEIAGTVEAETVQLSGRVRDQTVIRARSLEVTLGSADTAMLFGDCELCIGDPPSKEAAISGTRREGAPAADAVPVPVEDPPAPARRKRNTDQFIAPVEPSDKVHP
jgi:cytoskeletal protein CcmA (bactofilin family)